MKKMILLTVIAGLSTAVWGRAFRDANTNTNLKRLQEVTVDSIQGLATPRTSYSLIQTIRENKFVTGVAGYPAVAEKVLEGLNSYAQKSKSAGVKVTEEERQVLEQFAVMSLKEADIFQDAFPGSALDIALGLTGRSGNIVDAKIWTAEQKAGVIAFMKKWLEQKNQQYSLEQSINAPISAVLLASQNRITSSDIYHKKEELKLNCRL